MVETKTKDIFILEEGQDSVRIIKGKRGMIYFIKNKEIDLRNSISYEASEKGRCIGFEVKEIDFSKFDAKVEEYAREKGLEIARK